jgi:hypothetical protein
MAFKKNNGRYVRMLSDGTFIVYLNEKEREAEKQAAPYEKIKLKYEQIIENLLKNKERYYYDPEYYQTVTAWQVEYQTYITAHTRGKKAENLTLILQYFPNAKDSLPIILNKGRLGTNKTALTDIYIQIKDCKIFGEVEDC